MDKVRITVQLDLNTAAREALTSQEVIDLFASWLRHESKANADVKGIATAATVEVI